MLLLGIFFSFLYWIGASAMNMFIFARGDILGEILSPGSLELGIRLFVVSLIMVMSFYFKFVISIKKKTDNELDKKYGFSNDVLDTLGVLVVACDLRGRIVRFNKAAEDLSGYSLRQASGQYIWKLLTSDSDSKALKNAFSNIQKHSFPAKHENSWLAKNKQQFLIKWVNTVFRDESQNIRYILSVGVDVTEYQHNKQALQSSNNKYKDLIDNMAVGISLVSRDRRMIYANKQMQKWFPENDIAGRSICHDIFSDYSDKSCHICPTCRTLEDGQVHESVMNVVIDSKSRVFKVVSFPVTDNNNKVAAAVETVEDFTKINKQEQEIRHNYLAQAVINSLLRFSLENITLEGFLKCSLSIILSTPGFSSESLGAIYLIGDDPDILDMKAQSNLPEAIKKGYQQIPFNKQLYSNAVTFNILSVTEASRSRQPVQEKTFAYYSAPVLYAGNILGVINIYFNEEHKRDKREEEFLTAIANTLAGVIHRKITEERLGKINECFVNLGINVQDNIRHLVDLCGAVVEAAVVIYGRINLDSGRFDIAAKRGSCCSDHDMLKLYENTCRKIIDKAKAGSSQESTESLIHQEIFDLNGKTYFCIAQKVECRGVCKGVLAVFCRSDCSLKGDDKKFLGIISSAISIEEERLRENQELSEAYDKLKKAQNGLVQSEKLAALGRFSSGMAHEVKNPLGIILGGIEYLDKKLESADEDVRMAIGKIKESTLRADIIIRNLLKFAMPSEIKTENVRPDQLVDETIALLKYRTALININMKTEFSKDDVIVSVDKNQIQQVLFNLIVNAVDAMPRGGQIKVKVYKALMNESFGDKPVCVIEVADTGLGISQDHLSKLFEPFFTTKRDKKGTGLGLSISKIIVENHKGLLSIESQEAKGTTVKIILPLADRGA
ncbi:MAG: ATP-binding protein [Candidatus Omnitrophica bacterium]|nr:ATP-binding protein [Candidatus Omnitrophota bacterium]MDD5429579.1 ATP-binding protein [Candidatus Omnitrophota bacterium]